MPCCRRIVWNGPITEAVSFYASLDFICPPRQDLPSFLQEVTTPSGKVLRGTVDKQCGPAGKRD
jgi:hypothetical protein